MSTNGQLHIDPEIRALIPPLTAEELAQLEMNLRADGCRDPLVYWKEQNIFLDGHHRKVICDKLGIGYRTVGLSFSSRDAAMAWVIDNQFGRRNLNDFQRAELALKLKDLVASESSGRMAAGVGKSNPRANLPQGSRIAPTDVEEGRTRDKLAENAGISGRTLDKVEAIRDSGIVELVDLTRSGEVSIDAAAQVATLPKKEQRKIAAAGPKAVKAKAAEIRKGEPEPEEAKPKPKRKKTREGSPVDATGAPIPTKLLADFEARAAFADLKRDVMKLRAKVKALLKTKTGTAWLDAQELDTDFRNLLNNLGRNSAPYAVCRHCGGRGCRACDNFGYLSKFKYLGVPRELRDAKPAAKGVA